MQAVLVGATLGLVVSSVVTFLDWRLNPGGIFHGDAGTNWIVVAETGFSWFLPVAAGASVVAALALFLYSRE